MTMNRRLSFICLLAIIAYLALSLCLKWPKGTTLREMCKKIETANAPEATSNSTDDTKSIDSSNRNIIVEERRDFGPGWHGENLHAGFKLIKGIRSTLYDFDRGLVKRLKPYPLNKDIANAETRGADFKLSFAVRDQYGKPVDGASVVIGAFQHGPSRSFYGKTDDSGIATISGFGTGELLVSFTNSSHYDTSFRYEFYDPYLECAKYGRWQPWNPLLPVTMVRKGEGEVSSSYNATVSIPKGECDIGLDLIRGEVAALANFNGTPNCVLHFSLVDAEGGEEKPMSLCIDFIDEGCGGQMAKRDMFSSLPFPTVAPEGGYERQLRFAWCRENVQSALPRMREDDMILFRVRAEDGLFRYGVIKYPLSASSQGRFLRLMVSVNAAHPDSRNLEPDPKITVKYRHFRIAAKDTAPLFKGAEPDITD